MSEQAQIELTDVVMSYPGSARPAVDGISLGVQPGELLTLLGPSGSGKSSLLNIIAGFLTPTSGRVSIGGVDVTNLPPHRRDIGMVFQNYALFPHMTVAQNVEFPLRQRKVARSERERRVREALELVHLAERSTSKPDQLSGGQRQRVALARAVVFDPELLLMDEPLGALDKALRGELQEEIRRLHRVVGKTLVFVTHDQEEALALSDRIAVIRDGRIDQIGGAHEVYERPSSLFSARFLGESTILSGTREARNPVVRTPFGAFRVGPALPDRHGEVSLMIRPEHAWVEPRESSADLPVQEPSADIDRVPAVVADVVYQGGSRKVRLVIGEDTRGVVLEGASAGSACVPGDAVHLAWRVDDAWIV